ncbi:MAG: HAMP domain-containing histidine kinase [Candidatus Marinimicrobia bacterium]|nr:HAMP domain-containing histidine kinase [Candidatus Neomarinimicrobiota bacterium]
MLKRINRSLYLKIIIILGINYFLFYSLTFNTQKWLYQKKHFKVLQKSALSHANLVIDKIESLATVEEVENELVRLNAKMRIIENGRAISFPKDMRNLNFEEKDFCDENTLIGFDKGLIARIVRNGKTYEMVLGQKESSVDYILYIYRVLTFIYFLIMALIIYYSLRWLLHPIGQLHKHVKEISADNLNKPLITRRTDELGGLINSFNDMKKSIRNMISSREQLLLDVSHELRTPLTRTNLSLEMMADCEEKADILSDVREMETMISELLESAKIQSKHGELNLEKMNVMDLIDDVVLYFENEKPGIELVETPDSVELNVDPERMKILLRNIISNGIKYSSPEAKPVEIRCETSEQFFTVKIKNYGEGIPEKDLNNVFEPFYRVDKSRSKKTGGYGLGMHLVKKIVDAHQGAIHIHSQFGEWAEVIVKLPVN